MSILDKFSMAGKVAVVTGSSRGIGFAIAQGLAEAGAAVVIAARDQNNNEAAAERIRAATGGTILGVSTDVTDRDSLNNMVATVSKELGPIDSLVNNAGVGFRTDALTLDDDGWRTALDVNLDGVWKTSQVVANQMVDRKTGTIVNIGSMSGMIVNRPLAHAPYGIAKAAVHHLTKSLASEWAEHNLRVNAIAPGYVKTEMADIDDPRYQRYWVDDVPMKRYAMPEEIAPMALFLTSDASTFVTGSVFVIDGGYTIW